MSAFGENRSNAQLKKELHDRVQGSRDSVREFSRALLEIFEGLTDKAESKDNMLIEVFCENMLEPRIKREIKRLVRTDPKQWAKQECACEGSSRTPPRLR